MIDIPQGLREKHSSIAREILRVNGNPYAQKVVDSFLKKIEVHESGCWQWKRCLNRDGYARLSVCGHHVLVHRWIYILFKGAVPSGLELDHLCRNRACVNPYHLEAVTHRENTLRGDTVPAMNAKKTHCPKGHPYNKENTYIASNGKRYCRVCSRARSAKSYYRRKSLRLSSHS